MAVCDKTFHLLQQAPYKGLFEAVEPIHPIPLSEAQQFDCRRSKVRSPQETKGEDYDVTTESIGPCCGTDGDCC